MLTLIEVAALDLACEMEEALRNGTKLPTEVILALSRLREAQINCKISTRELERFYEIAIKNRSTSRQEIDNVIRLHRPKLVKPTNNEPA